MKIYTRTGDSGETSLFGGTRVSKSDARVEAYGEVDELNACLGWALVIIASNGAGDADTDLAGAILQIQRDLFALGARLADPTNRISARVAKAVVTDADVKRLERLIDRLESALSPLAHFILAGGCEAGARQHLARADCRRAERRMVALQPPVDALLVRYMNRLSDLLFVMARWVNHRGGVPEAVW